MTLQKLNIIRNNTLRISHIVNQLLDYRRAELGMFRLAVSEIDINSIMNSIMESDQSLADKRHIGLRLNSTLNTCSTKRAQTARCSSIWTRIAWK